MQSQHFDMFLLGSKLAGYFKYEGLTPQLVNETVKYNVDGNLDAFKFMHYWSNEEKMNGYMELFRWCDFAEWWIWNLAPMGLSWSIEPEINSIPLYIIFDSRHQYFCRYMFIELPPSDQYQGHVWHKKHYNWHCYTDTYLLCAKVV